MTTDKNNAAPDLQPAELAERRGVALVTDAMVDAACKILHHGYDHESRKAYREACQKAARQALEAALAARQPGEQEPIVIEAVATIQRDGGGELYVDWLAEGGIHDLPVGDLLLAASSAITNDEGYGEVYAAPPAQGIDLGQLRALAEKFESYGDDEIGDAFSGPYYQCAAELRGLIDGQRDAAPGVGNG